MFSGDIPINLDHIGESHQSLLDANYALVKYMIKMQNKKKVMYSDLEGSKNLEEENEQATSSTSNEK